MRTRQRKSKLTWIAAAIAAVATLLWSLPSLIQWLAIRSLEAGGYSPATLKVETLTPWRAVIRDVDAGGKFKATSIVAEFEPTSVLDGHFRLIEVEQPNFNISALDSGDNGPPSTARESPQAINPRIDRLIIREGTGTIAVAEGTVSVTYAAQLTLPEGGFAEGTLDVAANGPGLDAKLAWQGRVPLASPLAWRGNASVTATLNQFEIPAIGRRLTGALNGVLIGDDAGFGIDLTASANDGASQANATIRGRLAADADGSVGQNFEFPIMEISAEKIPIAGHDVSASLALTDSTGPIAVAGGKFKLAATSSGTDGAAPLGAAELNANGEWRLDGLSLGFEFADFAAKVSDAKTTAGTRLMDAVALALSPRTDLPHQVSIVFGSGGSVTVTPEIELAATAFRLLPDGANLWIDPLPLRVSGFASLTGGDNRLSVSTGLAKALHATTVITGTAASPQIQGTITSATGQPVGDFLVDLGSSQPWQADITVKSLKFGAGGVAWSDVFGSMIDFRSVDGTISTTAKIVPDGDKFAGEAQVSIDGLSFTWSESRFENVGADLALDQIWPPRSTGHPKVSFQKVGAAVPIEDGTLAFSMPGDGTMVIDSLSLGFAGGAISGGPATIQLGAAPSDLLLDVTGVNLGALLMASTLEGLDGTGTVAGQIPLRLDDGALTVREGALAARNGVVRYRPATPSPALAAGGAIVGQALANFEYEELRATLNGDLMRDLKIAVHLKGKNPELMKGYPVEFNLNLEGPLGQIATSSLSAYRIPDTIKSRLDQESASGTGTTKKP